MRVSVAVNNKLLGSCFLSVCGEAVVYLTKGQYFFFVFICIYRQTHCVRAGIDTQVNSYLTSIASPYLLVIARLCDFEI